MSWNKAVGENRRKNVIILTSGLTGSSVLTALLATDGYWTGDTTFKKLDYDTYENLELIGLNERILADVGFSEPWTMQFEPWYAQRIMSRLESVDRTDARQFLAKCNAKRPWVWKDPRLWLTIRFWEPEIDFSSTAFLTIRRKELQSWISATKRRQIQSIDYLKRYESGVRGIILDFLTDNHATHLDLVYEDLLVNPEVTIASINETLNTELTLDGLRSVFRGKLYREQHGVGSLLHALAIYAKNYPSRYRTRR